MLRVPKNKLKETVVADGLITNEAFDEAVVVASRLGQDISDILIGKNIITKEYYRGILTRVYNIDRVDISQNEIDQKTMWLIAENIAREKKVFAFRQEENGTIDVAMEDPTDLIAIDFLKNYLKTNIKPFLASEEDLNKGLALYSKKLAEDFKEVIRKNIQASLQSRSKNVRDAALDLPVVAILDNMFRYAIASRASDVHIEILENEVLVRFRIDGILHEVLRLEKEIHPSLVARIKLLAGLKLDEHYNPQDGRFRSGSGGGEGDEIDVRVSVMPTFHGEKAEMRLLTAAKQHLSLEELGVLPDMIKILKNNIAKSYGMILVTGPTGSGKTTLLYSLMTMLNRPEVNIATIEDPIEYNKKYVNQTQVNPAAGITFAGGLRALLRQDPNIIMVGEIRDMETAEIGVNAALTGHLMLSSLHTNDAPSTIPRLLDMKIQSFLLAAVLNVISAQRLVRRICLQCIISYSPTKEEMEEFESQIKRMKITFEFKIPKTMFKGQGCLVCGGTGYKGRVGIYEILNITELLRKVIAEPNFELAKLEEAARKEGYITMFEDGLRKVQRGVTTLEEVLRVINE